MKYMLMTFGEAAEMFETKSPDWITRMIECMHTFNEGLRAAGELVETRGLVDGRHAKTVRIVDGVCVATDGPFAEAKESLVGYWVIDVESEARAIELALGLGDSLHQLDPSRNQDPSEAIEVRQIADGPPEA